MSTVLLDNYDAQIKTIPKMLYSTQAVFGGRPANMYQEEGKWRTITYNELVFKVENVALGLIKLGMEIGDLIGIKAYNSPRWIWSDLGVNFAGAASVSLYPSLSKKETLFIAGHSEMMALFVGDQKILMDTVGFLSEMPKVKYVICMEKGYKGNGSNILGLGELMKTGFDAREELLPELKKRIEKLTKDNHATMVYTSGTTGVLKGCMLTNEMILHATTRGYKHLLMHGHSQNYNMVALCVLPLSHIMEKVNSYYGPLTQGGCIGFSTPKTMMADIQVIKPTWIMWVPRLLSRIYLAFENAANAVEASKAGWAWAMDVAIKASFALEDEYGLINTTIPFEDQLEGQLREDWINANNAVYWRIRHALGGRVWDLNVGGAYLDPDLHRKFLGMGFCVTNGYGLTETGAGICHSSPDRAKVGFSGFINPDAELKLDDDGEIMLRSRGIIKEYYKNAEATAESFTPDGWFRTGDIGVLDEVGNVAIVDRKKTLIILDTGKNVASSRIEGMCSMSGLLDQVAVLGQDKKFIAALIAPNYDVVLNVMKSQGIPFDESKLVYGEVNGMTACIEVGDDIAKNDFLFQAVKEEINKVNDQLEDYERIKSFRILKRKFTEEDEEVTPSSKLKMKIILDKYANMINDIYK